MCTSTKYIHLTVSTLDCSYISSQFQTIDYFCENLQGAASERVNEKIHTKIKVAYFPNFSVDHPQRDMLPKDIIHLTVSIE